MDNFMRAKDIAKVLQVDVSTVWRWAKSGKLPRGTRLTAKFTVWKESEVEEAINRLFAEGAQKPDEPAKEQAVPS